MKMPLTQGDAMVDAPVAAVGVTRTASEISA